MDENWQVFVRDLDDQAALIFMDLGAFEDQAQAGHLVTLQMRVRAVGDNGLPTSADLKDIYAVEEALDRCLKGQAARYVGRLATSTHYVLHVYTAQPDRTVASLQRLLPKLAARQPQLDTRVDPEWDGYGALYPTPEEMQGIQDQLILRQLREHGDDLSKPRQVDHWLHFDERAGLDQAAQELERNSFRVLGREGPSRELDKWVLHVARVDSVRPEDITRLTVWILYVADQNGGEYDGWETSVET